MIFFLSTPLRTLKNFFYAYTPEILQMFLGLVSTYYLVRWLSQEQYGEYQFILSFVGLATISSLKGLNNATMQSVARGYTGTYYKAVSISFLSSLVGSFILLIAAFYFYYIEKDNLGISLIACAFLFPFAHGLTQWKSFATGKENFKLLFYSEGFIAIITTSSITLTTFFFTAYIVYILVLVLGIIAIVNVIMTYKCRIILDKSSKKKKTERNITYGIQTSFFLAFQSISTNIDKILLFFILSPISVAIFAASERIVGFLQSAIQKLLLIFAPRYARLEKYSHELNKEIFWISFFIGLCVIIFAYFALPKLIIFVFGIKYEESIFYAQLLAGAFAFGNIANFKFRFIRSKLDTKNYGIVIISTSIVKIVSSVVLTYLYGIMGTVISAYIYRISFVIIVNSIIKRDYLNLK